MVDGSDDAQELAAECPADERHTGLEAAKEERQHHGDLEVDLLHAEAFADGHGERVHRKADGEQKELDESHIRYPPRGHARITCEGNKKDPRQASGDAVPRVSFIKTSQA